MAQKSLHEINERVRWLQKVDLNAVRKTLDRAEQKAIRAQALIDLALPELDHFSRTEIGCEFGYWLARIPGRDMPLSIETCNAWFLKEMETNPTCSASHYRTLWRRIDFVSEHLESYILCKKDDSYIRKIESHSDFEEIALSFRGGSTFIEKYFEKAFTIDGDYELERTINLILWSLIRRIQRIEEKDIMRCPHCQTYFSRSERPRAKFCSDPCRKTHSREHRDKEAHNANERRNRKQREIRKLRRETQICEPHASSSVAMRR